MAFLVGHAGSVLNGFPPFATIAGGVNESDLGVVSRNRDASKIIGVP